MRWLLFAASVLFSCTSEFYKRDADLEVDKILQELEKVHIQHRAETVKRPLLDLESTEKSMQEGLTGKAEEVERILDLRQAMAIATRNNRNYMTQRESLYKAALSLTLAQYNFGPIFDAALSYLYDNATGSPSTGSSNVTVSGTQILPTGGTFSLSATSEVDGEGRVGLDANKEYDSSVTGTISLPLWRGSGYEVSHESLTQTERNAVYAVRDFELFREDFAIDVLTRYYNLVSQKRVIRNQRQNYEQFEFLRRRSEAFFQVGRAPKLDVLRARQQELSAQDRLIQAEESYKSSLDSFKIFLGFSPAEEIDVADEQPKFIPVNIDDSSAVEVALANRLDLQTSKERLEDAERKVRIAKDGLGFDFDLDVSGTFATSGNPYFSDQTALADKSWSVGLTVNLPIDRKAERNAYRDSLIERDRRRRGYELDRDNTIEEVRRTLRQLRRRGNAIQIQKLIISSEERRLKIAEIRFKAGEIENRDVVEAQQGLLEAQNAYIGDMVAYEILRIQLKRDLGILFLGNDGMPIE